MIALRRLYSRLQEEAICLGIGEHFWGLVGRVMGSRRVRRGNDDCCAFPHFRNVCAVSGGIQANRRKSVTHSRGCLSRPDLKKAPGGRARALDDDNNPQTELLTTNQRVSIADICERYGISKATLYRYAGSDGERRQ